MNDVVLRSGAAALGVARRGAEARFWRVGATELLWRGDPAVWPEISPILFPVVGFTRDGARVNGENYDLGLHGFARRLTFEIERRDESAVRLVACESEATLRVYPFRFALAVEYALEADLLRVTLEATNTGDTPMPYACGLHPGFRWPFADGSREGARVRFAKPERAEVPVLTDRLFSAERRPVPLADGVLPLDDSLFAHGALCFLGAASAALRFEQADGSALEMSLDNMPHIALWTLPPAPYLCLEAWTGHGDPVGFAGDLYEKPSMRVLAPGESARHRASFRFIPAGGRS